MTDERKKERLIQLEKQWAENRRKIRRYEFLLEGLRQRQREIEEEIKEI